MRETSALWKQILSEPDHQKEVMVKVNGVEYGENRIISASITGRLFDAPSVGNCFSRTLTLNLMPYDGANGKIPPMSEIRLFVRLVSADRQRVSEYIQKGVFYSDEVKRDNDTGMASVSAFDAIIKMEREMGNAIVRITFDDGFGGIQRYRREVGDSMPTPDTPERDGERFLSWYPDPADTPALERDMLFAALWQAKFTVTFDGGYGTEPQVFYRLPGAPTPTPEEPTKEGFYFDGWFPELEETVTRDITYTALWTNRIQRIETRKPPNQTRYLSGEALDYTGLSVVAVWPDGTERDVTQDCAFDPEEGTIIKRKDS